MNILSAPRLDCLSALLARFTLSVSIDFAGVLERSQRIESHPDHGGFHILRTGAIRLDQRQTVLAPALILMPRRDDHQLHTLDGERVQLVSGSVCFGMPEANPIVASLPELLVIPLDKAVRPTLLVLEQEITAPGCGTRMAMERLCEVLLVQSLRQLITHASMSTGVLAGLADPRLALALTALHTDPAHAWTLPELARVAGMSRTAFAMTFHQRVGRTPGEYLGWWRAALARQLLEQGLTLNQVAGQVGYDSPAALARQMRRTLGVGPREIRRRPLR